MQMQIQIQMQMQIQIQMRAHIPPCCNIPRCITHLEILWKSFNLVMDDPEASDFGQTVDDVCHIAVVVVVYSQPLLMLSSAQWLQLRRPAISPNTRARAASSHSTVQQHAFQEAKFFVIILFKETLRKIGHFFGSWHENDGVSYGTFCFDNRFKKNSREGATEMGSNSRPCVFC